MRLIINNKEFQLEKESIVQTKQINDLFSLDARQTNYTNSIKIPRTPANEAGFEMLGIVGNDTNIPYMKNECYLYSDSGECFIYKGWAQIISTSESYSVTLYDGNLDFYKAIEGVKLSEIPMPLLNHEKKLSTVVSSFSANSKYRYMLANFGGKLETYNGTTNIDYLAPFANVKYIWECVFNHFGYTFECSSFNTARWEDLWLSYPKGTFANVPEVNEINATDGASFATNERDFIRFLPTSVELETVSLLDDYKFVINTAGTYSFELKWTDQSTGFLNIPYFLNFIKGNFNNVNNAIVNRFIQGNNAGTTEESRTATLELYLEAGEIISFLRDLPNSRGLLLLINNFEIKAIRRNNAIINFNDTFVDWSVKDFFNEILWRFGLTPYKDKYKNHYRFLTIDELTKKSNVVDYSDKFVSIESETYIYSNYAQQNFFKYKYDDEGVNYYDGVITIQNENLDAEKTSIQSKTFAPTKLTNGEDMWKMYDKEINDNGEVSYKNLSGRFFFATSIKERKIPAMKFKSDVLPEISSSNVIYKPSFKFQKYDYIISNYYGAIYRILNKSKIINANLRLTEYDVINFDFRKPLYIKQLGGNFLVNKIINYNPENVTTKVELIKVVLFNTKQAELTPPLITISDGTTRLPCGIDATVELIIDRAVGTINMPTQRGFKLDRITDNIFMLHGITADSDIVFTTSVQGQTINLNPIKVRI